MEQYNYETLKIIFEQNNNERAQVEMLFDHIDAMEMVDPDYIYTHEDEWNAVQARLAVVTAVHEQFLPAWRRAGIVAQMPSMAVWKAQVVA